MSHKDLIKAKIYHADYYQEHKEEKKAQASEWRKSNPEKHKKSAEVWRKSNPDKMKIIRRNSELKHNYGITIKEYQQLWDAQNGLCAICNSPETVINPNTKQIKWLAVDHDYKTGEIRALLCKNCNVMLGKVNNISWGIKLLWKNFCL